MTNTKVQSTDYNIIASEYDEHEKNSQTLWHLGYRYLYSYVNPANGISILDYGCGSGIFCRYMREYNADVTGVDISENMIKVAKKAHPRDISYNQITSGNLDFLEDESFDFVVSNFVFCTISTRNEILEIMKSIHRILKKDGSFLIMNPNWDVSKDG
jgi:ubiquinone/menaquinone biosynthesis C-methylase UbiE